MIASIKGQSTQDIFDGIESKASRKIPSELHDKARRLLDLINAAARPSDLGPPKGAPGNHLKRLKGYKRDFFSVRVNDQWRVIFRWHGGQPHEVEIVDYHG